MTLKRKNRFAAMVLIASMLLVQGCSRYTTIVIPERELGKISNSRVVVAVPKGDQEQVREFDLAQKELHIVEKDAKGRRVLPNSLSQTELMAVLGSPDNHEVMILNVDKRTNTGTFIGAGAGLVAGVLAGLLVASSGCEYNSDVDGDHAMGDALESAACMGGSMFLFPLLGTAVGTALGAALGSQKTETVRLLSTDEISNVKEIPALIPRAMPVPPPTPAVTPAPTPIPTPVVSPTPTTDKAGEKGASPTDDIRSARDR